MFEFFLDTFIDGTDRILNNGEDNPSDEDEIFKYIVDNHLSPAERQKLFNYWNFFINHQRKTIKIDDDTSLSIDDFFY